MLDKNQILFQVWQDLRKVIPRHRRAIALAGALDTFDAHGLTQDYRRLKDSFSETKFALTLVKYDYEKKQLVADQGGYQEDYQDIDERRAEARRATLGKRAGRLYSTTRVDSTKS